MRILFISTPVGAIGSGLGGGVETDITCWMQGLRNRGHDIAVIAPSGSNIPDGIDFYSVSGLAHPSVQAKIIDDESCVSFPAQSVLNYMYDLALEINHQYNLVFNFAYDWLPFYLTPVFQTPVIHFVTISACNITMTDIIQRTLTKFPGTVGVYTQSQAATYPFASQLRCIQKGFPVENMPFNFYPAEHLAWVSRISPEKGLEDAARAAQNVGRTLKVYGVIENSNYFKAIESEFPCVEYEGFLTSLELFQQLASAKALLFTPKWVEAFGNVIIEAMACGVPVIAYSNGGPSELIHNGYNGYLVEPNRVDQLSVAVHSVEQINRQNCRQFAQEHFGIEKALARFERWFDDVLCTASLIQAA